MGIVNTIIKGAAQGIAKPVHGFASAFGHLNSMNIEDTTDKNLESAINNKNPIESAFDQALQLRNEQWAREDAIRSHVEMREDSAAQRWLADLRKAGINPNLAMGLQGAASGGGITSSTGIDYTMYEKEFDKNLELLVQEIENNFKGSQAEKDRVMNLIKSIITGGALLGGAAIKNSK